MKKLLLLLLGLYGFAFAQQENTAPKKRFNLKLHASLQGDFRFGNQLNFNAARPGIQLETARGLIHQLELSGLGLGKLWSNPIVKSRNFFLSAAYEFFYPLSLFKNQEDLQAYIGLGINTSISSFGFDPQNPTEFFQSSTTYLNRSYLIPSLRKNINQRLFMDFSLALYWVQLTVQKAYYDNPGLPPERRNSEWTLWETFLFEQIDFRFGLGFRL